ncbi:MAG: methyltransferase domain-containing protein [Bacteroidia bacterium]|nr:methyltransferase domain-containing protein [Bacteroidia bacterium]
METISTRKLDTADLEQKVKHMYRDVALRPEKEYHFEMGRGLAEKLGYSKADLDSIPSAAIESFAGVGYYFDMAGIKDGEWVLDLGSGSGTDVFVAALKVGLTGKVCGADMTDEQLEKAERLRKENNFSQVSFHKAYIEKLPFENKSFDVVISNGVINLCADKGKVFTEVCRVLKPGGRMVIADIVTEKQLPENVVCNSTLWAACIGGASQQDEYKQAIENAGMEVLWVRNNDAYAFISKSAKGASKDYGVKSVSLLAGKNEIVKSGKGFSVCIEADFWKTKITKNVYGC